MLASLSLLFASPVALPSAFAGDGTTVKRDDGGATTGTKKGKKNKGPKLVGPFAKGAYPRQERLRPLVLPGGMVEGELSGGALDSGAGLNGQVAVRAAVGLGDRFELAVGTGVTLTPAFAWNQTVQVDVAFLAIDGRTFDMAPGLSVPLTFADGAGFQLAVDLTSRLLPKTKGLEKAAAATIPGAKPNQGLKVFVYFGNDAIPITLSPELGLGLAANGGAGLQLSQGTAVMVDTTLASVTVLPDTSVTGLWETLVVNGAVQHSPNQRTDLGLRATVKNPWNQTDPASWGGTAYGVLRF